MTQLFNQLHQSAASHLANNSHKNRNLPVFKSQIKLVDEIVSEIQDLENEIATALCLNSVQSSGSLAFLYLEFTSLLEGTQFIIDTHKIHVWILSQDRGITTQDKIDTLTAKIHKLLINRVCLTSPTFA